MFFIKTFRFSEKQKLHNSCFKNHCTFKIKQEKTLYSMALTIRYPLLSLRQCERDGDVIKATLLLSLEHLVYSATTIYVLL